MDDLDFERLVELQKSALQATTMWDAGYFKGRVDEYVAQNALTNEDVQRASVEAMQQIHV